MRQIDNLSSDPYQITSIVLDDGSVVVLELIYKPAIQRWLMNVTYGSFVALGINLCAHFNILRNWRHKVGFGLACVTTDRQDPVYLEDFSNGRASLYLLPDADVSYVESQLVGVPS